MPTRIGVNGFGRIGRQVTRAIIELYPEMLSVAAVNDLADAKTNAHLFRYDTNYGIYPGTVEARDGNLVIDGQEIRVFSERDPAKIPWGRARGGACGRVHGHIHRCRQSGGPYQRRRQEGHHIGSSQERGYNFGAGGERPPL